ncbi:MAG: hypothetical protein QF832_23095 [SAR324 cluster bacterium]|nr:hypothetical protein [SAR324 cluster bacterium]
MRDLEKWLRLNRSDFYQQRFEEEQKQELAYILGHTIDIDTGGTFTDGLFTNGTKIKKTNAGKSHFLIFSRSY